MPRISMPHSSMVGAQVLHGMCPSRYDWSAFLHACCVGAWPRPAASSYAFVAGAYTDVPEDRWWLQRLMHRAQVRELPGFPEPAD